MPNLVRSQTVPFDERTEARPCMREVAELNGDGVAPELREAVHVLNDSLGSPVAFRPVGWTLQRREAGTAAADEGVELTGELGAAMKYPTVTKSVSPNQVLGDRLGLAVIHRPCRTYPGVSKNYSGAIDLHVVRVVPRPMPSKPAEAARRSDA